MKNHENATYEREQALANVKEAIQYCEKLAAQKASAYHLASTAQEHHEQAEQVVVEVPPYVF